MKVSRIGVVAMGASLLFGACNSAATPAPSAGGSTAPSAGTSAAASGDTSKGTVKFAIELPLQGSEKAASDPIINGVKLAIKQAGGAAGGYAITLPQASIYDDALNGAHDPQTGAKNMQTIVADADVVAVIGPLNSSVALTEIPISNAAGLFQCSPANTNPTLTKPPEALNVRKTNPTKINYVRVVTTDDYQGPAAAQYLIQKLGKKNIYIIDDTETFGKGIADAFAGEVTKEGATVAARDGVPKTTTDYTSILTNAKAKNPDAIYFGGVTATGGARILKAAVQVGMGGIPFVGPDGINDGSATTKDSFLNLAGDDAKNSLSTLAGIGDYPGRAAFETAYKAEYGAAPTGYASTGFACAQVAIDALKRAGAAGATDMAALREGVRKAGSDTTVTYDTIIGKFTFDANGDTSQKIISIYAYDATSKDWAFKEQIDYAAK